MEHKKRPKKKATVLKDQCVACGCCEKVCPMNAIEVYKGIYAKVKEACIGCGKCKFACPASVIEIVEVSYE